MPTQADIEAFAQHVHDGSITDPSQIPFATDFCVMNQGWEGVPAHLMWHRPIHTGPPPPHHGPSTTDPAHHGNSTDPTQNHGPREPCRMNMPPPPPPDATTAGDATAPPAHPPHDPYSMWQPAPMPPTAADAAAAATTDPTQTAWATDYCVMEPGNEHHPAHLRPDGPIFEHPMPENHDPACAPPEWHPPATCMDATMAADPSCMPPHWEPPTHCMHPPAHHGPSTTDPAAGTHSDTNPAAGTATGSATTH